MKLTLTSLALLLVCTFALAQNQSQTLLFDYDAYVLKSKHKSTLNNLLDSIAQHNNYSITIAGHTDADGTDEYNKTLSQNRTNSVKDYFINHNIPIDKIKSTYLGEKKPVANNGTESGKQQNRRVEIIINYQDEKVVDIWRLYEQTINPPKEYAINNTKDTILRCEKGTLLYIKANSFTDNGGPVNSGKVTLKVKEVYDKSDMILESLTTTSDKALLETSGMIYINAFADDNPLEVVADKSITVFKPTKGIIPSSLLFTGSRNAHDSIMNWSPTESSMGDLLTSSLIACAGEGSNLGTGVMRDRVIRPDRCPFFFCKIDRFFSNLFTKKQRSNPNRGSVGMRPVGLESVAFDCEELDSLMEQYGVDNYTDLYNAIQEERIKKIESNYDNSTIQFEDLQYYTFNLNEFGWSNIDAFLKLPKRSLATVDVNLKPEKNTDVRLVFRDKNILAPAYAYNGKYRFDNMPKGQRAYLVALKYEKGTPLVSIEKIRVEKGASYNVNFKKLSLEELKNELKKINS